MDTSGNLEKSLVFEQIVAAYEEFLLGSARGFDAPADFLSIWVPSEDTAGSILNMIVAALDWGEGGLSIRLAQATLSEIDFDDLVRDAGQYGEAKVVQFPDGVVLSVSGLHSASETGTAVHASYRSKIAAAARLPDAAFPSEKSASGSQIFLCDRTDGVEMAVVVDRTTQEIVHAGFRGARTPTEKGMLRGFCDSIVNKPLQDAAEYGAIRLEAYLRETEGARPVRGIVIPQFVEPAFDLPLTMVRRLYGEFLSRTGKKPETNFYEDPVDEAWLAKPDSDKIGQIQVGIDTYLRDLSGGNYAFKVLLTSDRVRFVGQFGESVPTTERAMLLFDLERYLRSKLGVKVELYLSTVEDLNALRQPGTRPVAKKDV